MIAAAYLRKSDEQGDVVTDHKSVARQLAGCRKAAAARGDTIPDDLVFVDDGITGADFVKRAGFLRLMSALKARPSCAFQVLYMSEESRLGRHMWQTGYAYHQIAEARVRVFFYLHNREADLQTPEGQLILTLQNYAAQVERNRTQLRVKDALAKRKGSGFAVGQAPYGYDLESVAGPRGTHSHTLYTVHKAEARIVVRVFTETANGDGATRIARGLNRDAVALNRKTKRGKPVATRWDHSMIQRILRRDLYRGVMGDGETRHVNERVRIVSDDLWARAHAALDRLSARYAPRFATGKRRQGRDRESAHKLIGFLRCGPCGGPYVVRYGGRKGAYRKLYKCHAHATLSTCTGGHGINMDDLDRAVLRQIEREMNDPATVQEILDGVYRDETAGPKRNRAAIQNQIKALNAEIARYMDAVALAPDVPALVGKLRERSARRDGLAAELERRAAPAVKQDRKTLEREIRAAFAAVTLDGADVQDVRTILRGVLDGPIVVTATRRGEADFRGRINWGALLAGTAGNSARQGTARRVTGTRDFRGTLRRKTA